MSFQRLISGAGNGALAGLLYGLAEYAVVILEPMLRWGPRSLGPEHWFWETLWLATYVFAGAVVGAAAAGIFRFDPAHSAPRAVIASGLLILIAGRLPGGISARNLLFAVPLTATAAIVCWGLFSPKAGVWLKWMTSLWVCIPLVFAFVKIAGRSSGLVSTLAVLAGVWAATALVVLVASRIDWLDRTLTSRSTVWTASICLLLLVCLPAASLSLGADPRLPTGASAVSGQNRPNLLLIVLDTVRADHLSVYGYRRPTTPNLEAFAREAVVFENAVAAGDMTLSSYGSIYTGLYPSWHHALPIQAGRLTGVDSSFLTLAERLSQNGYINLAVLANSGYLNRDFGMQQGFDYYDVRPPVTEAGNDYYLRSALSPVLDRVLPTGEMSRIFRRSDQITDGGLRVFNHMRGGKRPFFLSLNYMDAHEPYLMPAAYRARFASPEFNVELLREVRKSLAAHYRNPRVEQGLRDLTAQYDSALAFMDDQVKRLLDGLRAAGLYDNTMIVITSDHGEALGERDDLNHPASVHPELVRVPLLIKYPRLPGMPAPERSGVVASGVDLLPTLLDTAGLPVPANLHGRSLRSLRPDDPQRVVISESFTDSRQTRMAGRTFRAQRALYRGPWKLIFEPGGKQNGGEQLYHWQSDPAEEKNLYATESQIAASLTSEIQQWIQAAPRQKSVTQKMDRQTMERLRGLGYVQ